MSVYAGSVNMRLNTFAPCLHTQYRAAAFLIIVRRRRLSLRARPSCASGDVCSPSTSFNSTQLHVLNRPALSLCTPGFFGSSFASCRPVHVGPAYTPCMPTCARCADGIVSQASVNSRKAPMPLRAVIPRWRPQRQRRVHVQCRIRGRKQP